MSGILTCDPGLELGTLTKNWTLGFDPTSPESLPLPALFWSEGKGIGLKKDGCWVDEIMLESGDTSLFSKELSGRLFAGSV